MIEEEPHLFIALGEVSSHLYVVVFSLSPLFQQHKKREGSWREADRKGKGESKVGQLLMYLLGGHLHRLRAIRHTPKIHPTPVLGRYLEDMKVITYLLNNGASFRSMLYPLQMRSVVADMTHNGAKSYVLTTYMNEPLHFAEGGMERTINMLHKFLSFIPMNWVWVDPWPFE